MCVWVDDPLTVCHTEDELTWYDEQVQKHFETQGRNRLGKQVDLDFLGMRISTPDDCLIYIDNESKIDEMLLREGMQDCNPVQMPITKEIMQRICEGDKLPLNDKDATHYRQIAGEIGWLE